MNRPASKLSLSAFTYLCFLVAWSAGNIYLLAKQFLNHTLLFTTKNQIAYVADFVHFYAAGLLSRSAQAMQIYDPLVQLRNLEQVIAPIHLQRALYFEHPPILLPFLAGLSYIQIDYAYLLWISGSLVALIASGLLLFKYQPGNFKPLSLSIFLLAVFSTLPGFDCFSLGQLSCFIVLLATIYVVFLFYQPNDAIAGIALSLLCIKPHYAIFMFLLAFILKRWRLLAWAALGFSLLLNLTSLFVGWQNILNYPALVLHADSDVRLAANISDTQMCCLRGVLANFFVSSQSLHLGLIIMCAGMLATAAICFCAGRAITQKTEPTQKRALFAWSVAITIELLLICSPHTHLFDCLLLALPAYLTLSIYLPDLYKPKSKALAVYLWTTILYPVFSAVIFCLWEYVPTLTLSMPMFFVAIHLLLLISSLFCFQKIKSD